MALKITSTKQESKPALIACIYGVGGAGKTTLATTAPKPVFIDSEDGTKALGARGIDVPVIKVQSWNDVREAWKLVSENKDFETVVIDPTGQFMELLINQISGGAGMDLKKWGEAKAKFRDFLWALKRSGKNIIFVAHDEKRADDTSVLRSPKLSANLSDELVNMCDIVGYMFAHNGSRYLRIQPSIKITAKDRFELGIEVIENPNIAEILSSIHKKFS